VDKNSQGIGVKFIKIVKFSLPFSHRNKFITVSCKTPGYRIIMIIETVGESRIKRKKALDYIQKKTSCRPEYLIILGTGLGRLADQIDVEVSISYADIPYFPTSTVESHAGRLLFGKLGGKNIVAMQGRFHYYEGYSMQQIAFPVRVLKTNGANTLLVSNACGGVNPNYRRGDIMCIVDHINLLGDNPLLGPNDEELGARFPDMSEPYSADLIRHAEEVALENGIRMHEGVYASVPGPMLETRAEYRYLRYIGSDVVGMSTIPEVISAVHMNMKVLGISVITDECFPDALEKVNIKDILEAADLAEPKMTKVMTNVLERL
ncbi:MAG: purine-nucleoside phosphorylase, partial [Balneolales bacterium]